jgi:hypothetical protein
MRFALVAVLLATAAVAADLPKVDRTIGKQPKYAGTPVYCLLAFGPDATHRVWLVRDGDTLYVDKNGNGDLTDAGEAVKKTAPKKGREEEEGKQFEVGEIKLGGRTHKGLTVFAVPLADYAGGEAGKLPPVKAALEKDKKALAAMVRCEVEVPGVKGGGTGGRLDMAAGWLDLNGPLLFADKPADAPVIHFGGPLEVSFFGELPKMRVGRGSEFVLVVGTPGVGPGTFAMLGYEDCIPKDAYPKAEITFQPQKAGDAPVKELFEIKERC